MAWVQWSVFVRDVFLQENLVPAPRFLLQAGAAFLGGMHDADAVAVVEVQALEHAGIHGLLGTGIGFRA
jgi:hypothetical protein